MGRAVIRVILVVGLLGICLHYALLAYQTDMHIQLKVDPNAPILEQARTAMRIHHGRIPLNPDFLKYVAIAAVTGIISAVLILGGGDRRPHSATDNRQRYKNAVLDFTGYEDYLIAFDTNILLDRPEIIEDASDVTDILIAKQVIAELDGKKKDEFTRSEALRAFYFMDKLHARGRLAIVNFSSEVMYEHQLNVRSADQRIIGAYIDAQKRSKKKVLFVSRDRAAKMLARDSGLHVYE